MKRFSVSEAAGRLGISTSLMYALLERRLIRHERHGLGRGTYVIPEDALEEYRLACVVTAVAPSATPRKFRHVQIPKGLKVPSTE